MVGRHRGPGLHPAGLPPFARMLRAGGVHEERQLMSEAAVRQTTSNQLTREERAASPAAEVFLGASG